MKLKLRNYNIFFFVLSLLLSLSATCWAQCPTVNDSTQTFCDLQSVLVSDLVATDNGNGVVWYSTATSTTPLSPSTGLVNNATYYADSSTGSCGARQSVTVTIYGPPVGISTQGDCYPADGIATVAVLAAQGNNVQWYDVPVGGTPLPLNTVLINQSIYYAAQTNPETGCESSRLSVYVSNTFAPTPTGPAIQQFCNTPGNPPTVADLNASGANKWYATASSAVQLNPNTPLVSGQSYFATTVVQQCESVTRLEVTVILVNPHNSGVNGNLELCQNTTGGVYDLFNQLGGAPEMIGTWSGPIVLNNGHLGTLDTSALTAAGSPYVFTYSVSSAICAQRTSTVTVTVLPLPVAAISANTTICSGEPATVTFTGLSGATISYTVNGGSIQTILLNSSGWATLTNTYTSSVTIALVSATSGGATACTHTVNGTITITVLPLPTVNISSDMLICSGGTATIEFNGTANAAVTYTVNGGPNQTIILNNLGQATITGNYTSTTTFALVGVTGPGFPVCFQPQNGTATITVVPVPTVSISEDVNICPGATVTVIFTGTPQATVNYTVNNGPLQSIVLDASGMAAVTNTYTATTTFAITGLATGGSTACAATVSEIMTINVLPLPVVSLSSNTTICAGHSATVTFTGTAGAIVTYTVNGGPQQNIILNSSGTATITNSYDTTTVFTVISAASAGLPSCSQPQNATMTIVVNPLPVVTVSQNQTICHGASATVTFTGTANATVTYNINGGANQVIILSPSGIGTITDTYFNTTTFNLVNISSESSGCSQLQSGQVIITVVQPPTANISGNINICAGSMATITFSGTANATISYTINNGPLQTILLDAAGYANITSTFAQTTIYTITGVSTTGSIFCSQPASGSVTVTVEAPPVVSISQNSTICFGNSATVTFTGTPNATVTYTVNNGPAQTIILNGSGAADITSNYTATTIYDVISVASAGLPSCSQPQTATMTITVESLPVVAISGDSTICPGQTATVNFIGTANAVITYTINGGTPQTITLDATGSAAITGIYNITTVFQLLDAALSSLPACSQPQSGTVTINVNPLPVVGISGNASICAGQTTTVTFTGTPNSTVQYTVNGGQPQSITIGTTGTTAITQSLEQNTTYALLSIATNGNPICYAPVAGQVTVSIVPPPVAAISGTTTICIGQSATVTFTGTPNAIITYSVNNGPDQTITLTESGIATITSAFSETTTYTLIDAALADGTCIEPQSGGIIITVTPLPVVAISQNISICAGGTATVQFSGTPNAVITYTVNGSPQTITLDAGGSAAITGNYNATTTFSLVNASFGASGCSQIQNGSTVITVTTAPTATIAISGSSTVCSGQIGTVVITGTPHATVFYTVNGGPNQSVVLDAIGSVSISSTLTGTTTYSLVSASTEGIPSCSAPQTGTITLAVTPIPVAGNDVTSISYCENAGLQDLYLLLGPNAQPGGTWFPVLSSGDGFFDPLSDPAGTYIYTVSGTAPCPDDTATVTVTIAEPPFAGNDTNTTLCSNYDPQDLFTLLGPAQTGGFWTPALASGSGIFDPTNDSPGTYTYTVVGEDPCADDTATVYVTVVPGPDAGQNGTLVLCANSAPQNLFPALNGTPSPGGTWSPTLASGSGIFNPGVDAPGIYTYTFAGNQPCDNDSATVDVTVNPIPDAGADGTVLFCTNYQPADLFLSLMETPQPGGTWSPALESGTGVFNPLIDAPGIYTYSVGGGFCTTDTSTVAVTVNQSPNAGGNGATLLITTCFSTMAVDLFSGLNGTQAPGTWTDDDSTGALINNIFNPSTAGPGSYHFTYTVGGGVSPCLFDTATVTVVVDPTPNAGNFLGVQTVCSTAGAFDLLTLLANEQAGGTWTNGSGLAINNPIDLSAFAAGIYSFTYTVENTCASDTEIVQLNVSGSSAFTNTNIMVTSPVCIGNSAIINFSGIPNGSYTLNYNLGGSNPGTSQTVLLTISGGVGTLFLTPAVLSNIGSTSINFNSILNNATGCLATLTNVALNFIVSPVSSLTGATITAADVCLGSPVSVQITNAGGLPDGNYQFNYTISGQTPGTGSSGIVTVANHLGTFTIPASTFNAAGSNTLTINNIVSISGCSNFNVNASAPFNILATSNTIGADVAAFDTCVNSMAEIQITGAANIPDGVYTLSYTLSGASAATLTAIVEFSAGDATIVIPANMLVNPGSVTVTFNTISGGSACSFTEMFDSVTFNVGTSATPVLLPQGNEFCASDDPTVASLNQNISGQLPVTWYNADIGGISFNSTDLLVHGQSYYGELTNSGCQINDRLRVIVDLTICDNLLIPDGFSPNGDNINDEFVIIDLLVLYPKFTLEIYNRYGNVLYKGNINTPNWDGTSRAGGLKNGSGVVPVGVYFYILQFNDGTRKPAQGRLYLSR